MSRPKRGADEDVITPSMLLRAYACGIFPMADSADDPTLYWVEPRMRGRAALGELSCAAAAGAHRPLRPLRGSHRHRFRARRSKAAPKRSPAGASPGSTRPSAASTAELFRKGHVHTVEAWRDGALVGGLYGLALGGAFFGESMFARERDASKVALVHLMARLKRGGFTLVDTQFLTPHLVQFGAVEIPRDDYVRLLDEALAGKAKFSGWPATARRRAATEALEALEAG